MACQVGAERGIAVEVVYYDIENGPAQDLANEEIFCSLLDEIRAGSFDGALLSPPCSTFSGARKANDGGPRPLRGVEGPSLYGLPGLFPDEKEAVRLGTLLAIRASQLAREFEKRELPWVVENPPCRDGKPSLFSLREWQDLWQRESLFRVVLPQCQFGCPFEKPTELRGRAKLGNHVTSCQHPEQWFRQPPSGTWSWTRHPALRGRISAVQAVLWDEHVHPWVSGAGCPYLTRATAAYPEEFNLFLAGALVPAAPLPCDGPRSGGSGFASVHANDVTQPSGSPLPPSSRAALGGGIGNKVWTKETIQQPLALKHPVDPQERRKHEESLAIGGLRNAAGAVRRCASAKSFGRKVRQLLDFFLDRHPEAIEECASAIGSKDGARPAENLLPALRAGMARLCGASTPLPLTVSEHHCSVCGPLLEAWSEAAGDPDTEAATWPRVGAPAGILQHPGQCGIFPDAEEVGELLDPLQVQFPDPETRDSYASVEKDDHAAEEIQRLVDKGFLLQRDTLAECRAELGNVDPVVSKFGLVVRVKDGKTKRRLILDAKESGITACARKNQRILLPTAVDQILSCLRQQSLLMQEGYADTEQQLMVLDVKDAFWTLPNTSEERRYLVGRYRGKYYIYLRLAQGSRGAPLAWCRFIALVARLCQAAFDDHELLLHVYVDDPVVCVGGTPRERRRHLATLVLLWRCINLELAFEKGSVGRAVDWIGVHLELRTGGVDGSMKRETVNEVRTEVEAMLRENVVGHKRLLSLAGKLGNIARLLTAWRPFLQEIWAALYDPDESAPSGCVWTRRFRPALAWFLAFLQGTHQGLVRPFDLQHYLEDDNSLEIVLDASPWGMGAIIRDHGTVVEYFSSPLTSEDTERFGFPIGDASGQQTWECLCCLVALRTWSARWRRCRSSIGITGDNMTMLTMVLHLKVSASARHLGLIAREIALLAAEACYRPRLAKHLPGIANVTADALSRLAQPGKDRLPSELNGVQRVHPEARGPGFYRTLRSLPPAPSDNRSPVA